MALQLRRGTNAQRLAVTPVDGELIFVTDWQSVSVTPLWLGDGSTVGGIPANSGLKLDDLTDVVLASVAANQHLQYDSATSKWINVSNMTIPGTVAATGAYLDQVNIGVTDAYTIDTQSGDLKLDAATNNVLVNANLNVDSGVLYVDATTNRVGVNTTTPLYEVDAVGTVRGQTGVIAGSLSLSGNTILSNNSAGLNITGSTTGDVKIYMDELQIDAGSNAVNSKISFRGGSAAINYNSATGFFELNKPAAMNGDLYINGPVISSSASNIEINTASGYGVSVNRNLGVGGDLTVTGNLTVNGDLTYLNVSDLQVEDRNVILAKGNSVDGFADGGGITLKGATDKTITWHYADNRWYFNDGDGGGERPFVRELNDIQNVNTGTFQKGHLLVCDGVNWFNTSSITFDSETYMPKFVNNASNSQTAASLLNKVANVSPVDGDATGALTFGIRSSLDNDYYVHRMVSEYDSGQNHIFRIQVDPTNQFAPGSNTAYSQLRFSDTIFDVHSTRITLDANNTAAGKDGVFAVNRGTTAADATLTWDETQDRWEFNNPLEVQGQITGTADLDLNGTTIQLNSGYATGRNSGFLVDRGSSGTDATFLWDETFDSWVASNTLASNYIVGYTNIATNGYNVIFNNADTTPTDTDHANLLVKRGSGPDVALRWNETTDTWQHTRDGSTYWHIPAQNLDSTASPSFAGVTGGNIKVGVTTDNTIDTGTGDITIAPFGGTVAVSGSLTVSSGVQATSLNLNTAASSFRMGTGSFGQITTALIQPTTTTSTTTTDLLGASVSATAFRSMEFTLQATSGTNYQIVKGVAIHDGTNTYINTSNDIRTGSSDLFTVNATIAGGDFKLQVTSASATSTTYKGSWTAIAV